MRTWKGGKGERGGELGEGRWKGKKRKNGGTTKAKT
jgi:hypothetical protein